MQIFTTSFFGQTIQMRGDFAQAGGPVQWADDDGGWVSPHGQQVADFQHSPERAMRHFITEMVMDSGDDPADLEREIDAAIEQLS